MSQKSKKQKPNIPPGVDVGQRAFLMWPSAAGETGSGDGRQEESAWVRRAAFWCWVMTREDRLPGRSGSLQVLIHKYPGMRHDPSVLKENPSFLHRWVNFTATGGIAWFTRSFLVLKRESMRNESQWSQDFLEDPPGSIPPGFSPGKPWGSIWNNLRPGSVHWGCPGV